MRARREAGSPGSPSMAGARVTGGAGDRGQAEGEACLQAGSESAVLLVCPSAPALVFQGWR